jgi:tRNA(Arg) A34 adenosine deaminase TadA
MKNADKYESGYSYNDIDHKSKNKNNKFGSKRKNKQQNIFRNVDVYVVRVKNNTTSMSKPCAHCVNSLKMLGIRRVYYSTGDYRKGEWICEKVIDVKTYISSGNRKYE